MNQQSVNQQLQDDLKAAMKAKDVTARETIRFTMSAIKYAEIEQGGPLSDEQTLALLQRETKRRVDSIDQFRSAGRKDLVEREEAQLDVLKKYMPKELSDDELQAVVIAAIESSGATSVKELGKVMPIAIERAGGGADGKRISAMVRSLLAES